MDLDHKAIHTTIHTRSIPPRTIHTTIHGRSIQDLCPRHTLPTRWITTIHTSIRSDHDLTKHHLPDVRITAVRSIPLLRYTPIIYSDKKALRLRFDFNGDGTLNAEETNCMVKSHLANMFTYFWPVSRTFLNAFQDVVFLLSPEKGPFLADFAAELRHSEGAQVIRGWTARGG